MKRKTGIKLFRSHSDRVLGVTVTTDSTDPTSNAHHSKSGDKKVHQTENSGSLHASLSFCAKMRPKKHGGGGNGNGGSGHHHFRLSSLLPGTSSSSSRNLVKHGQDQPSSLSSEAHSSNYDSFDSCQLLSVRKRSSSDSGHDSSSVSSHNDTPPTARSSNKSKSKSSSSGGSFFKFFNRSATLLFHHPPASHGAEHGSRKPYKGVTSSSTKDLRSSHHPILGNGGNGGNGGNPGREDPGRRHHHHRRGLSASSSSSLSSSVMHHHLENVVHSHSGDPLGAPCPRSLPLPPPHLLMRQPAMAGCRSSEERSDSLPAASSSSGMESSSSTTSEARDDRRPQAPGSSASSSNSVISSDYDSGAFSRTSTPDLGHHFQRLQAQIQQLTGASKSSLALAAAPPLNAPKLVIEACRKSGSTHHLACVSESPAEACSSLVEPIDAGRILNCLSAASRSSTFPGGVSLTHTTSAMSPVASPSQKMKSLPFDVNSDVSITIGTNTKLTITPLRIDQSPRRSRSGMPVLGTAGLTSPSRGGLRGSPNSMSGLPRSRISTVYLTSPSSNQLPQFRDRSLPRSLQRLRPTSCKAGVSRSESSVTLSTSREPAVPCCTERVTVNGQHYHCDTSVVSGTSSPPGTQPSSLINI